MEEYYLTEDSDEELLATSSEDRYTESKLVLEEGRCNSVQHVVESNANLTDLTIWGIKHDTNQLAELMRTLQTNQNLEALSFVDCDLNNMRISCIATLMVDHPNLKRLELTHSQPKKAALKRLSVM